MPYSLFGRRLFFKLEFGSLRVVLSPGIHIHDRRGRGHRIDTAFEGSMFCS